MVRVAHRTTTGGPSVRTCAGCHRPMDSLGLVLEQYDHVGRFRTIEAGKPVDTTGVLAGLRAEDLPLAGPGDPRTGAAKEAGVVEPQDRADFNHTFTPPGDYPGRGNDWVLVLDDASLRYPAPGTARAR